MTLLGDLALVGAYLLGFFAILGIGALCAAAFEAMRR